MTDQQGKWPIVLAAGLLCAMTLLSIASWLDRGQWSGQMAASSERESGDSLSQDLVGLDQPEKLEPLKTPQKKIGPQFNRYDAIIAAERGGAPANTASTTLPNSSKDADDLPSRLNSNQQKFADSELPLLPFRAPQNTQFAGSSKSIENESVSDSPVLNRASGNAVDPAVLNPPNVVFGDLVEHDFSTISQPNRQKTRVSQSNRMTPQETDVTLPGHLPKTKIESKPDFEQQLLSDIVDSNSQKDVGLEDQPKFPRQNIQGNGRHSTNPKTKTGNSTPNNPFLLESSELPGLDEPIQRIEMSKSPDSDESIIALIRDPRKNPRDNLPPFGTDPIRLDRQTPRTNAGSKQDNLRVPSKNASFPRKIVETPTPRQARPERVEPQINMQPDRTPKTLTDDSVLHPPEIDSPFNWGIGDSLSQQLLDLANHAIVQAPVEQTFQLLERLGQCSPDDHETVGRLLRQIDRERQAMLESIKRLSPEPGNRELVTELSRFEYHLRRRIHIWSAALRLSGSETDAPTTSNRFHSASSKKFNFAQVPQAWRQYLLLDKYEEVQSRPDLAPLQSRQMARKVLARATANHLTPDQFAYVEKVLVPEFALALRKQATGETDLQHLFAKLEKYERDSDGISRYYLNDHYQSLYWSQDPAANYLAEVINVHYRNANLRVSISETLVNRWLNQLAANPITSLEDETQLNGLFVSELRDNRVSIDLKPALKTWKIQLISDGMLTTRSKVIRESLTHGMESTFSANKIISISPHEIRQNDVEVDIDAQGRISNLAEQMGRLSNRRPLSGGLRSQTLVESKMEAAAKERFEAALEKAIRQTRQSIRQHWINPLARMDLEPQAVSMNTTEKRMNIRYRIAGNDQMAAHTARPMAVKNCDFSTQMHESAINNYLSKTKLGGQSFTLKQFARHLNEAFGGSILSLDHPDLDSDVEFTLAQVDPLRLDFDQQHLALTARMTQLRIGTAVWKNVAISCPYDLKARRLTIQLTKRAEGIHLSGKALRLRDQIAIRTAFQQLLAPQYQFELGQLTPFQNLDWSGLWISQLVLSDGWIGISINDSASLPANRNHLDVRQLETDHLTGQRTQQRQFR